jgi:hypothetical protein
MADIAAGVGPVWFLFSIPLPHQCPAGSDAHRLVARGIPWRVLPPSAGISSDISSSCCSAPLRYAPARSSAAGCGRLAPRRAVPSSGTTANRPRRLWAPTKGLCPPCGSELGRGRWASVTASFPVGVTDEPTGARRMQWRCRRLRTAHCMLRTRPSAGHRVISQVGCLRETRSDHPDQEGLWGRRGRGVASRPGIPGRSEPTSRRPAWTPVRDRWQRRLAIW